MSRGAAGEKQPEHDRLISLDATDCNCVQDEEGTGERDTASRGVEGAGDREVSGQ